LQQYKLLRSNDATWQTKEQAQQIANMDWAIKAMLVHLRKIETQVQASNAEIFQQGFGR